MSSSTRRSSRRATVVSTLASNAATTTTTLPPQTPTTGSSPTTPTAPGSSPAATPSKSQTPSAAKTPTPTKAPAPARTNTEIIKEPTIANCPLYMECEEDVLTASQKTYHTKRMKLFQEQMMKLESLAKVGAKISAQKDGSMMFRTTETTTSAPVPINMPGGAMAPMLPQQPLQPSGLRLLMDPKTGRILGTINGNSPLPSGMPPGATMVRGPGPPGQRMPGVPMLARAPQPPVINPVSRMTPTRPIASPAVVDLVRSQSTGAAVQSGSTSSGRSKNFPALAMQPKPQKAPAPNNSRRPELDAKVKSLLVHTPAKFTEWLIQQGMVPSEQFEVLPGKGRNKLKLGMYSDSKKFPNSGGYVWISESNANKFTSVFRGSIFEATTHEPIVVLKLIYHWACQTNISNVLTWVKVDNATVDLFFKLFRAVCVASVHNEILAMGGNGKTVEIGVISLGTTTSDGNKREVRVEVLGVLDRTTGLIRLRATEPIVGASQAERFSKIFEPMPIWVQRNTKIITDYSVDKDRLLKLGYISVVQCSTQSKRTEGTNSQIMDYLKSVVPKMFQNSLSHLTTPMIQQFLDELTFRESFGTYPLMCFDSFIQRVANQTSASATTGVQLVGRLRAVADNPFMDWRINPNAMDSATGSLESLQPISPHTPSLTRPGSAGPPGSASASAAAKRSASELDKDIDQQIAKKFKVASELVDLESYFYATLQGEPEVLNAEFKADMAFKCHLCKKVYMNNIEFMKHLSLHVETDRASAVDLADLCQCKYCYKEFETPYAMQSHLEEIHLKKGSEFVCRICDEGFNVKNHLIHHMSKTHVKSEMPYLCQICGYRSSMHRDLIDHFQEAHDRTDKLQCPRCLKTFSLFSDKGYNSSVASSFVTHLQQHKDKKVNCKKCCLIFHNEQGLKSHNDKDHVSFKSFDNLDIYQYSCSEEAIKMPKPDERNSRTAAKKSGLVKTPQQQSAFAAQNLEDVVMYDLDRDDNCGECGKKFNLPGHYTAYLCCTKCRYSTCCSRAISVHVALFHGASANPMYNLGAPVILESDIFCCCGFKTNSGNKMAKHLGTHGCKSAYPDAESAEKAVRTISSASFAPLVSLDEGESVDPSVAMAQAYVKQKDGKKEEEKKTNEGPLAFLGLQRKSIDEDDKEKTDEQTENKDSSESEKMETDEKENEKDNVVESEKMETETEEKQEEAKAVEANAEKDEKSAEDEQAENETDGLADQQTEKDKETKEGENEQADKLEEKDAETEMEQEPTDKADEKDKETEGQTDEAENNKNEEVVDDVSEEAQAGKEVDETSEKVQDEKEEVDKVSEEVDGEKKDDEVIEEANAEREKDEVSEEAEKEVEDTEQEESSAVADIEETLEGSTTEQDNTELSEANEPEPAEAEPVNPEPVEAEPVNPEPSADSSPTEPADDDQIITETPEVESFAGQVETEPESTTVPESMTSEDLISTPSKTELVQPQSEEQAAGEPTTASEGLEQPLEDQPLGDDLINIEPPLAVEPTLAQETTTDEPEIPMEVE